MRIDVHHHVLPPFYLEAIRATDYDRTGGIRFPEWHPQDSLEVMDRHGIDTAVLSVSTPGVAFLEPPDAIAMARRCNEWMADLVAAHPGRFGAFACLPLGEVEAAVSETVHALDGLGLHGVTLFSSAGGRHLGDARFEPLMAELDRRRAVAFLHPTTPPAGPPPGLDVPVFAVEFVADTTRAIANLILSGTLEAHPGIAFVCAHGGGFAPFIVSRLEAAWSRSPEPAVRAPAGVVAYLRRLHYDTAAVANPLALPAILALAGPGRVLLGTDFPFASEPVLAETLAGLRDVPGLGDNALCLLPGLRPGEPVA
ncbi:MAG: amidohydrolase family protein [Acidimicrobiia bacterium]